MTAPARSDDEKFRSLLEAAPDAMVIVDGTGSIVLVNSQTERVFGYRREELLGRAVEVLIPQPFRESHPRHRRNYDAEPRVRRMGEGRLDLRGLRRDGTEMPVEISLSPLRTEDGMLVIAAIRDVTERRRFETALNEQNMELERAIRAKDRFLASMSHELRTPLNAIIGFTGTLLMRLPGPLTEEQEKQLRTVQTSARHLLSLINDLLDLAKIESGKFELQLEPVVCEEILSDVAASLAPLADAKDLVLDLETTAEPIVVRSDRRALTQIVLNLAHNAVKFTDGGRVRLSAARRRAAAEDEAGEVEVRISDTGIGIRPEDRSRLFSPFERLGPTAHREGTGLGLNLSQRLAERLGGRIEVESEYGTGSTFSLVLPEEPP